MDGSDLDKQRQLTWVAIRTADLNLHDVWVRYFGLAGSVDEYELDAYVHGLIVLPHLECDLVAQAVNELIDEIPPLPRAPYGADIGR
jgi:hypothetical protein